MRLVVTQYVSLDGVIEDPVGMENSGLGDWTGAFNRGPEGDAFKHQELMHADAILLGRKTYEGFAAVWPGMEEPTGYADRINSLPKFVASRTMGRAVWNNSTVISTGLEEQVLKLKNGGNGTLLVFGSASLVHCLLTMTLVDELTLMVYPVALGRGLRLFPDQVGSRWSLNHRATFDDGIVMLRYTCAGDQNPNIDNKPDAELGAPSKP